MGNAAPVNGTNSTTSTKGAPAQQSVPAPRRKSQDDNDTVPEGDFSATEAMPAFPKAEQTPAPGPAPTKEGQSQGNLPSIQELLASTGSSGLDRLNLGGDSDEDNGDVEATTVSLNSATTHPRARRLAPLRAPDAQQTKAHSKLRAHRPAIQAGTGAALNLAQLTSRILAQMDTDTLLADLQSGGDFLATLNTNLSFDLNAALVELSPVDPLQAGIIVRTDAAEEDPDLAPITDTVATIPEKASARTRLEASLKDALKAAIAREKAPKAPIQPRSDRKQSELKGT